MKKNTLFLTIFHAMNEKQNPDIKDKKANQSELTCPVCDEKLIQEKCKIVCRSEVCVYRIIYNCSEF
ncbi:MAG: hypothetical protein GWN56_09110 [Nitrosopumilaceae archaeon]|nr:hypothetical protein [Nitrosopumilaceae archaeon]NIV65948.1 hypothetical protein [Nitrosopumilaceae archaeon]